jgi:hypothetical protein
MLQGFSPCRYLHSSSLKVKILEQQEQALCVQSPNLTLFVWAQCPTARALPDITIKAGHYSRRPIAPTHKVVTIQRKPMDGRGTRAKRNIARGNEQGTIYHP